jgi:hypothetical protein
MKKTKNNGSIKIRKCMSKHETIGKEAVSNTDVAGSTVTKKHYTPQGDHPEDRIFRDREYIHRLQRHIDTVYDELEKDLGIREEGNWLFDFIYNEDRLIEFEDYLREHRIQYKDIVSKKKGRDGDK